MNQPIIPRILLTPGEPAGIGPDIVIQLVQHPWPVELVIVADPDLLNNRAKQLNLPLHFHVFQPDEPTIPGVIRILPVSLNTPSQAGQLNTANAKYVIHCLELATKLCLNQQAHALVTGPVHKGVINDAGIPFSGHTEFLAKQCNAAEVMMLFVAGKMKVALATTHLPLANVPKAITQEKLIQLLRLFHRELKNKFSITQPKILVCGLNPHAGEQGHLGMEEIETIIPALEQLRKEQIDVIGPLPADTIFTEKYLEQADAILAMYHDQALPVVKYLGFGHAVNVTLGLPMIRTSVDHGTALDIASTGQADAGSLEAALRWAVELSRDHQGGV